MSRALLWIGLALLVGYFFPALGAFMLNPTGAFVAAIIILGVIASVVGEEEEV